MFAQVKHDVNTTGAAWNFWMLSATSCTLTAHVCHEMKIQLRHVAMGTFMIVSSVHPGILWHTTGLWTIHWVFQQCKGGRGYPGSVGMMPNTLCKAPISIESADSRKHDQHILVRVDLLPVCKWNMGAAAQSWASAYSITVVTHLLLTAPHFPGNSGTCYYQRNTPTALHHVLTAAAHVASSVQSI